MIILKRIKAILEKTSKKNLFIFLFIIFLAIFVRIYEFPNALKEVGSDEMMLAVNAKSIADTGRDINGTSYPVYILGWGGQSVALLYLIVAFIKIFGYSLFTIRLPLLIISIISLFVFYDLIRRISKNNTIALIGLALLAISPWHILHGLWALDCNILPHIILIAVYLLYIGVTKGKRLILYLSMVFFAITLYSYGIAIYFTPILLVIVAIYLVRSKEISIFDLIMCIIIFSLLAMPIVLMFIINILKIGKNIYIGNITIPYYESLSRTNDMLFFSPNILIQLFINIGFTILIILGEYDGCQWNSSLIFGTTYHITLILLIITIIFGLKSKKNIKKNIMDDEKFPRFLIISWVCTSIFTGVVINQTNINRLNTIWYPLIILATFKLYYFYNYFKDIKNKTYLNSTISIFIVLFISYIAYFNCYYSHCIDMSICFSRGMYQALKYTNTLNSNNISVDNLDNDGSIDIYLKSNDYFTNKSYSTLKSQDELNMALSNLKYGEVIILNQKREIDTNNYICINFGEYYVVLGK